MLSQARIDTHGSNPLYLHAPIPRPEGCLVSQVTVGERILVQLSWYLRFSDAFECPRETTQDGIAEALGISRAHAALELKRLKASARVEERMAHVAGGRTRRKVYFLTSSGARVVPEGVQFRGRAHVRRCPRGLPRPRRSTPPSELPRLRGVRLDRTRHDPPGGPHGGPPRRRRPCRVSRGRGRPPARNGGRGR